LVRLIAAKGTIGSAGTTTAASSRTTVPCGLVPFTMALLVIEPAVRSDTVVAYSAVHTCCSPGASTAGAAGLQTISEVSNMLSLIVTSNSTTSPSLVAVSV
jgi:hypothetical protein